MSLSQRIQNNVGFLLAGAVLFAVIANVYFEIKAVFPDEGLPTCQSTSIQ